MTLIRTIKYLFRFSFVSPKAYIGKDVKIGRFCIIGSAYIDDNTIVKNYVEIRDNVAIGKNCYIDSRVSFSGNATVSDNVTIRYSSIIARNVYIGKGTFIAPQVMTEYMDHKKESGSVMTVFNPNCFIGTASIIKAGVNLGGGTVIGANSYVNKNTESNQKWAGNPAKLLS